MITWSVRQTGDTCFRLISRESWTSRDEAERAAGVRGAIDVLIARIDDVVTAAAEAIPAHVRTTRGGLVIDAVDRS